MPDQDFHFLSNDKKEELYKRFDDFVNGKNSAEDFLRELREALPIEKTNQNLVYIRVEGLYLISDLLFSNVQMEYRDEAGGKVDRKVIIKKAKLRPLSYYHWLTGSREPVANVMNRRDSLNDPTTSLVKLEDDIVALGNLYRSLKMHGIDKDEKGDGKFGWLDSDK